LLFVFDLSSIYCDSNSIDLKPGFRMQPGTKSFKASIYTGIESNDDPLIYQKTSLTGYPACDGFLKSAEPDDKPLNDRQNNKIAISPVPCSDYIDINTLSDIALRKVEIYNETNLVFSKEFQIGQENITINTSNFASGIYIIRFR